MAGRTPPASRGRAAGTTRGAATTRARQPARQPARKTARKAAARPAARTRARSATRARPSVSAVLVAGLGRGVGTLWMGVAHGVGWVARGVGRQAATAKEIDPEHRRDGAGLLMLGLAILVGVAVWAYSAGPVGARLADAVRLFFGGLSVLLPLLLLYGAVRFMRQLADPEHRGRSVVGWTALVVSTASLLHLAQRPADDLEMDRSGGLIGYGVGALLERAVTAWVAVPLLILLLIFGLLVITATPINRIPERLMLLIDVLLGRSTERAPLPELDLSDLDDAGDEAPKRRSPARRRQGSLSDIGLAPDAEDAEDPIVHDTVLVPRGKKVPSQPQDPPSRPSTRRCRPGPSSSTSPRSRATTGCRRRACSARARRRSPAARPTTRS
nr:hypothetical protein GCM10020092_018930 [Actinoplanes digitatis]